MAEDPNRDDANRDDVSPLGPPIEASGLAAYQAGLLELLHGAVDGVDPEAVRSLAGDAADALGEMDPVLLAVAADLTRTWGRLR